jgi:BNR repeat-like domain
MNCVEKITVYQNPDPLLVSRQAVFPGFVQLAGGDLLAMFSIGQAFDAADQRAFTSRSRDGGRSWDAPRPLVDAALSPADESECYKPLLLADGSLLASGYGFVRPDPLTPIVDPETLALPPMKNKVSFSRDDGHSWSAPVTIDIEGAPLEMSGPCIQLASGRILGACSPFHLGPSGHAGWIVCSDDGGHNWRKLSEFFSTPKGEVSAWECRLCEAEPGRIAVLIWAYDNARQRNLANHIVFSHDGGVTFAAPLDTGIMGQASNLIWLGDDQLLTIHTHREHPVALTVRRVDIRGDGFVVLDQVQLFGEAVQPSDSSGIRQQFASLKFGQPSLLRLQNGQVFAACWGFEACQYVIKGYLLEI